eukprot:gnl/Dysnectes_brevis/4324_a5754_259.p1 GENE.gnl/Dysnectes_brevis/4324_a5754_259~~gnl/Dysnectes_brevis/4324_a5754_259.p1  ORF type:complete len:579 (-),score=199.92 gnl/Dysnectes_brevis/4324_a5754_259:95-1831(-)
MIGGTVFGAIVSALFALAICFTIAIDFRIITACIWSIIMIIIAFVFTVISSIAINLALVFLLLSLVLLSHTIYLTVKYNAQAIDRRIVHAKYMVYNAIVLIPALIILVFPLLTSEEDSFDSHDLIHLMGAAAPVLHTLVFSLTLGLAERSSARGEQHTIRHALSFLPAEQEQALTAWGTQRPLPNHNEPEAEQLRGPLGLSLTRFHALLLNPGKNMIVVRRTHLLEDMQRTLAARPLSVGRPLVVQFRGEVSVDLGGLARELFTLLGTQVFDSEVFHRNAQNQLELSTIKKLTRSQARHLSFCGWLMASALLHNAPLPVDAGLSLVQNALGRPITLQEARIADPQFATALDRIMSSPASSPIWSDPLLGFTFLDMEGGELVPGGANKPVTYDNRERYIWLLLRRRFPQSLSARTLAAGFALVLPPEVIRHLPADVVRLAIFGCLEIDLQDWMRHTRYGGHVETPDGDRVPFSARHPVAEYFWTVLRRRTDLRPEALFFATGLRTPPAGGFSKLGAPSFRGDEDLPFELVLRDDISATLLPTAHSCLNRLELPPYGSVSRMEQALSLATRLSGDGNGLR